MFVKIMWLVGWWVVGGLVGRVGRVGRVGWLVAAAAAAGAAAAAAVDVHVLFADSLPP